MEAGRALRAFFGSARPVWIAGSTHAGEEELVLAAHARAAARCAVAAGAAASGSLRRRGAIAGARRLKFARRSGGAAPDGEVRVVLVDSVGVLAALYAAADAAFVGGSLVPIGGHNLLEPAALGVPVLTGPFTANGREIAQMLLTQGAALQVADAQRARGRAAPAAIRSRGAAAHGGERPANRRVESRQRRAAARPH